jgi:DNA-binding CsgD family transcriptional regulator
MPLSAREVEVLHLVAAGRTNPQIATALQIAPDTVRSHMQRLSAKLGVSGRAAIVSAAYQRGWLRLPNGVLLRQAAELMARQASGRAA